jgi:hypothetical protein
MLCTPALRLRRGDLIVRYALRPYVCAAEISLYIMHSGCMFATRRSHCTLRTPNFSQRVLIYLHVFFFLLQVVKPQS